MSSTTSTSPSSTPTPDPTAAPCWECQRRQWVCDATRPVCIRCREAGIVCPGYSDRKPLTWLAPGRISARPRRTRPSKPPSKPSRSSAVRIKTESDDALPCAVDKHQPLSCIKKGREGTPASTSSKTFLGRASKENTHDDTIKCPAEIRALAVRPRNMEKRNQGPRGVETIMSVPATLRDHMDDVFEATQYYNSQIYPLLAAHQLAPNLFVAPIEGLQLVPASMRHALISLSLGYRILQLPPEERVDGHPAGVLPFAGSVLDSSPGPVTGVAGKLWWRAHDHVGAAIRLLKHDINHETSRTTTATIISVFVLLITELFQTATPQWRSHCIGFTTLMSLRGGLQGLMQDPEDGLIIRPSLLTYVIMIVMANTTSPSYDQVDPDNHVNMLETIEELCSIGMYPRLPCPQPLFVEIVRINDLRWRVATRQIDAESGETSMAVRDLLRRVMSFSPETWAAAQTTTAPEASWLVTARCYQSAVLLFADATLIKPLRLLESNAFNDGLSKYRSTRAYHRTLLLELVAEGLSGQLTKFGIIWPVIVAGFEAATGTAQERSLVENGLTDLCRGVGATTVAAREALIRFWKSGKGTWDECFDQPYAFII
ncbi:hypothetical protein JDV02_004267 [Purpureocillium takamizusanense]|uniref:Zn(2)-C6 fungal-type domain-containing protein n=1 Tax=Purpureocillium takamizusanense TaxID=2060973 RepID=A0A9Q8QC56_9HYPO|nr:uncharacterized protein JDV02_004267 [Purpureocillium takamizusanense]UNI17964.1 hypothetical protein JDV02_004267 [Purpureocillium takamizusanense]